jgi:hypothetical protein
MCLHNTPLQVTVLRLPRTKVSPSGEDIYWGTQLSLDCDPNWAVENHLRVNAGANDTEHFFAYRVPPKKPCGKKRAQTAHTTPEHLALTFAIFSARIKKAATAAKIKLPPAHAFRIGGTTEYLLRGLPFEVVKHMGRWAGESFKLYIRKHAEIMAPYLEEHEEATATVIRAIELPPVRA